MSKRQTRHNYDFLVRVVGEKTSLNKEFVWSDKQTFLGFTITKEGFYCKYSGSVSKEYLEKKCNLIIDGKRIFNKPTIKLFFVDGSNILFIYNTDKEMELKLKEFKSKIINGIDNGSK